MESPAAVLIGYAYMHMHAHTHKHIHAAAYNLPGLQGRIHTIIIILYVLLYLLNFSGTYENNVVRFVSLVHNAYTAQNGQGT